MSDHNTSHRGIGFCGLLTLIFITLKLTSVIDWSWWWVLSPIWISLSIGVAIFAICLLLAFVFSRGK